MNRMYRITAIIMILFLSCTKKLENPGATNTVAMSNEWWVTLTLGGNDLLGRHVLFSTYNTSQNVADSLWLDDLENGYDFKCKVLADPKNLTFTTDSSQNEYYDIRVHIANGKIIPNGGKGYTTGSIVDSIYMEASFGDDPGDTFIISGVARSRWAQDDYN
jgi:Lipid-binding putative hydrolase